MRVANYDIETYFPKGLNLTRLQYELEHTGVPIKEITVADGVCSVVAKSDLTSSMLAATNTIVGAHTGDRLPTVKFHAASLIVQSETTVTQSTEWQSLGGIYSNASFFIDDLNTAFSTVTGSVRQVGDGLEIRFVEIADGETIVMTSPYTPKPEGKELWNTFELRTVRPPTEGEHMFQLEARLNESISASVRFCNASLLEIT